MYRKTIVCLANSRKPPSGRCIAGIELADGICGPWIRPVSDRPSREISEEERRYADGQDVRVLETVSVPLERHLPQRHQTENHVVAAGHRWERVGACTWDEVAAMADPSSDGHWPADGSSFHGTNDRILEGHLDGLSTSLAMVRPRDCEVVVQAESQLSGPPRRRVRARFQLGGSARCLVVTDPVAERHYLAKDDGTFAIGETLLTLSLTPPFEGHAYMLVAALITPRRSVRQS